MTCMHYIYRWALYCNLILLGADNSLGGREYIGWWIVQLCSLFAIAGTTCNKPWSQSSTLPHETIATFVSSTIITRFINCCTTYFINYYPVTPVCQLPCVISSNANNVCVGLKQLREWRSTSVCTLVSYLCTSETGTQEVVHLSGVFPEVITSHHNPTVTFSVKSMRICSAWNFPLYWRCNTHPRIVLEHFTHCGDATTCGNSCLSTSQFWLTSFHLQLWLCVTSPTQYVFRSPSRVENLALRLPKDTVRVSKSF